MVFSSLTFLTCALPIALAVYYILPRRFRNAWLLLFSLVFYAWGEPVYLLLMLGSITLNYGFGLALARTDRQAARRVWLALAVCVNIGMLVVFKYLGFFADIAGNLTGRPLNVPALALPIGISFYTFQALSYTIDVYRGDVPAQRRWDRLALYVSFFPQLIAGPILRYGDVSAQIEDRGETLDGFARGMRRFIVGLAKKVLIANAVAPLADEAFAQAMPVGGVAWIGAVAYAIQIYFDFSGYSDMAIGLGAMFGFVYPENFNDPYCAVTIRDFWRRWHISLSTWFRDYLYIPLGGSRRGKARHIANLIVVFLVTGLWHGASMNFLVWGLYYGLLCAIEALLGRGGAEQKHSVFRRMLTLLLVLVGWVIFRAETLTGAINYLKGMCVLQGGLPQSFTPRAALALAAGALLSTALPRRIASGERTRSPLALLLMPVLLALCLLSLASGAYNPFIYFRF